MRVDIATEPAVPGGPNEDFVGATKSAAVLLDGAGIRVESGCRHGVAWFARQLGAHLLKRIDDHSRDLPDILADAIDATAGDHRTCDLLHPATPSATVVLFRKRSDVIEHLVLADSVLILLGNDGTTQAITDDRESRAGEREQVAIEAAALGTPEHDQAFAAYVQAQLSRRNTVDGFWVASTDPEAARHALHGKAPSNMIQAAALLSDGASRLVDRFRLATWTATVRILQQHGPAELIRQVREAELTDLKGSRWPRGKCHDDASAALVSWTGE